MLWIDTVEIIQCCQNKPQSPPAPSSIISGFHISAPISTEVGAFAACSAAVRTDSINAGPYGQKGVVSIIQIFTDSVSICMSRIRPNSTTFIPSSGSITSRSESLMSVLRESSVCCISVVDVMGLRCDDEYRLVQYDDVEYIR